MRIVGGTWRGRVLAAPQGSDVVRPTTDRMREAIASMVLAQEGLQLEAKTVLDAFAGSGAIAFELVSRGARAATLIERDKGCANIIRKNIEQLSAQDMVRLIHGDAFQVAKRSHIPGASFDIVVLDPPYALEAERLSQLIDGLYKRGIIKQDALVVYEHQREKTSLSIKNATIVSQSHKGITSVELLRLGAKDVNA